MPRCLMACAFAALFVAAASSGCGSHPEASNDVSEYADADGAKAESPEGEEEGGKDGDDKSTSDDNTDGPDDAQSPADKEPTAASLDGLSFELRPFTERDGDKVRVEGHRKHYSNSIVVLHGKYTQYYGDGSKQAEGQYKDDAKSGKWTFWHVDGQKSKQGSYAVGLADGNWTHWRPDGTPQSEGQFQRGRRVGVWTLTDTRGNKTTRDYSPKPE